MHKFIDFLLIMAFIFFTELIIFSWGVDVGKHGGNFNYKQTQEDRIQSTLDAIELKLK